VTDGELLLFILALSCLAIGLAETVGAPALVILGALVALLAFFGGGRPR
jgi:hypothetical protein